MTIGRPSMVDPDAGDRRGDDTHWWKAYQLHSTVALAMKAHGKLRLPGAASRSFAHKDFRPTETEIHRAASKALGSPRPWSVHAEPSSD